MRGSSISARMLRHKSLALIMIAIFLSLSLTFLTLQSRLRLSESDCSHHPVQRGHAKLSTRAREANADTSYSDPWPEKETDDSVPRRVPPTVHYMWCQQNQKLRFRHYLGLLSLLRLLRPLKLFFHYTTMPQTDVYNSWFQMLKTSVPGLVLVPLPADVSCSSPGGLNVALDFLAPRGGVVMIGQNAVLARAPRYQENSPFSFYLANSSGSISGVIFANSGFDNSTKAKYLQMPTSAEPGCVSLTQYDGANPEAYCVEVTSEMFPRDVMYGENPFSELARWLFYGRRSPVKVPQDPHNPIPRVSHFIKFKGGGLYKEFSFPHFLSVLSALYVAEFDHVYLHVEAEPQGGWWEQLKGEPNLTVVGLDGFDSVFQQKISKVAHASDLARFLVVQKFGGAYQDFDVLWVGRIPDSLLSYPTVAGLDYHDLMGSFPQAINDGVFLSRRHSPWLQNILQAYKHFRDDRWTYNSGQMPYRMFELYPETVFVNPHLEVLCHAKECYPTWLEKARVNIEDHEQLSNSFKWKEEALAYHPTIPKPHPSLASLKILKNGKNMIAEIGRMILEKSGRKHLLEDSKT